MLPNLATEGGGSVWAAGGPVPSQPGRGQVRQYRGLHVGFIPREANTPVARALDRGAVVTAIVEAPASLNGKYIKAEARLRIYLGGGEPQL